MYGCMRLKYIVDLFLTFSFSGLFFFLMFYKYVKLYENHCCYLLA